MRLMLFRIESTWSWLALISSGDRAPLLAAWLVRLCTSSSSDDTSPSAPSAVLITLPARCELSIAWLMPPISLRSCFAGDQAGGGVLAAVDLQARAQDAAGAVARSVWFLVSDVIA